MSADNCENGLKGTFVEVPLDSDLPPGWRQKVYQMNGMLVPRWTIWYDPHGNKFVNKLRIKQMLVRLDSEEDSGDDEDDSRDITTNEATHDFDTEHSSYTLANETLVEYMDFDTEIEKSYYETEASNAEEFQNLEDEKDVLSLSDQIISHYQQQEDYRKQGEQKALVDTENILERYRNVIREEEENKK